MSIQSRRQFLKTSLAASAVFSTFTIAGTKASGRVLGANDEIRVGVAGIRGRGVAHISEFAKAKGVRLTYLIDPDTRVHDERKAQAKKISGHEPTCVVDVRKALADKNLDVLSIATPNHWHSLMTIWACQADKDVYVEKPLSHSILEGRVAVEVARKHNRIVQHGTQNRSKGIGAKVAALAESGQLGKLQVVRGLCYKIRKPIGVFPDTPTPEGLDFDLWLGPAEKRAFNQNIVPYNWHWFWDFGNGDIGNQGVHQMDVARWAIPDATLPSSVISIGGRFGPRDQGETPNTMVSVMDYGPTTLIFEVRGFPSPKYRGEGVGNTFHFEGGTLAGYEFKTYTPTGSDKQVPLPKVSIKQNPGRGHFGNFLAAVRSRKLEDLNADVLEGHYSSALCHMANISYRLGKPGKFDPKTNALGDNTEVHDTLNRLQQHLTASDIKLGNETFIVGESLTFNPQTEKFNSDAANKLVTQSYRAGFELPTIAKS